MTVGVMKMGTSNFKCCSGFSVLLADFISSFSFGRSNVWPKWDLFYKCANQMRETYKYCKYMGCSTLCTFPKFTIFICVGKK